MILENKAVLEIEQDEDSAQSLDNKETKDIKKAATAENKNEPVVTGTKAG